ncbi:MAG: SMC family ATPase [Megasphaera sp.]|nr:SMC family ATPase [Megasphaera sp.]
MIPVYLEMNAFGPYAARQIIDFRLLGDRKLFLIYGPTGAGKTTILDAICYALYGDTSGNIRTGSHMRSEYASPEEPTYVHFLFAIGQKQYRIERMPEQYIAKKRGTGLKHASSSAALYAVGADGEDDKVLATKNVNEEIIRLLGFKSEQFRQVVLLPQGDFRKLLLANSSERQQIMQTLFHTQRYADLQALAKTRHDAVAESYSTIQDRISLSLQAVQMENEEALAAALKQVTESRKETAAKAGQAVQQRDTCQKEVQQAQALASHWQSLEQCRIRNIKLGGQKEAMDRQRERVDMLRRAQILAEPCRYIEDIQARGTTIGKKAAQAADEAAAAVGKLAAAKKSQTAWEDGQSRQTDRIHELARLEDMEKKVAAYHDLVKMEKTAATESAVADSYLETAAKQLETWKAQVDTDRRLLDGRAYIVASWEQARTQVRTLEERVRQELSIESLALTLKQSAAQCTAATAVLKTAAATARTDRMENEAIRHLFLQGQAAVLAAHLTDGKACPVCGAVSHPQPAAATTDMPDKDDVDQHDIQARASEEKRQQAEIQMKSAEAAYAEQQRQYEELRGRYADEGTSAAWQQRLQQAETAEKALQKQVRDMEILAQTMTELQARGQQLEQAEKRARKTAEEKRIAFVRAAEAKRQAEASVPEPYRRSGAVMQKIKTLQQAVRDDEEKMKQAAQAVVDAERLCARWNGREKELARQVAELRRQYTDSMETLKTRVADAGFASVTECRAMQASVPQLAELQKQIDAYTQDVQQLRGQISQEEAAVGTQPKPDMEKYRKQLAEYNSRCDALAEETARLDNQVRQLQETAGRITDWRNEQADLSERYKTIGSVYDLVSGKYTGINFERYVLGALLDEVLTAANLRLEEMSRHRYVLQRSHHWEDKRVKQVGLDIEVFDNYTGYPRPANTLSGGETFLASLSLALGLADVVQAYSGGIHLDTIFIDEGFGTLDGETLDYALKSLLTLQQGGRLVGIISHVPELKERIDTRLAVTKTDRGSTAAFELL